MKIYGSGGNMNHTITKLVWVVTVLNIILAWQIPLTVSAVSLGITFDMDKFEVPGTETTTSTGLTFSHWHSGNPDESHWRVRIAIRSDAVNGMPGGWDIEYTLAGDQDDYDEYTDEMLVTGALASGQKRDYDIYIDFDGNDPLYGADYTCLFAELDSNNDYVESNENNNDAMTNKIWATVEPGEMTTHNILVTNPEASSISISNSVDYDEVPLGWTVTVYPVYVELDSWETVMLSVNITPPDPMPIEFTLIVHAQCSSYYWDQTNYVFTDENLDIEMD